MVLLSTPNHQSYQPISTVCLCILVCACVLNLFRAFLSQTVLKVLKPITYVIIWPCNYLAKCIRVTGDNLYFIIARCAISKKNNLMMRSVQIMETALHKKQGNNLANVRIHSAVQSRTKRIVHSVQTFGNWARQETVKQALGKVRDTLSILYYYATCTVLSQAMAKLSNR